MSVVLWPDLILQHKGVRQQRGTDRSAWSWVKWNQRERSDTVTPGQTDCDYLFLTSDLQLLDVTFDLSRLQERKIRSEVPYIAIVKWRLFLKSHAFFGWGKRFFSTDHKLDISGYIWRLYIYIYNKCVCMCVCFYNLVYIRDALGIP